MTYLIVLYLMISVYYIVEALREIINEEFEYDVEEYSKEDTWWTLVICIVIGCLWPITLYNKKRQ